MIVFDSATLILLAKAELLDGFIDDYGGEILVPCEVELESCGKKKSFDALLIRKRIEEKKIEVAKVSDTGLCGQLMRDFRISKGEAEAVMLAIEKKVKLIATDDKNGIRACKVLKIAFTSAITILVRMAEREAIDTAKARAGLDALIRYGRYDGKIIDDAKKRLKIK